MTYIIAIILSLTALRAENMTCAQFYAYTVTTYTDMAETAQTVDYRDPDSLMEHYRYLLGLRNAAQRLEVDCEPLVKAWLVYVESRMAFPKVILEGLRAEAGFVEAVQAAGVAQ